MKAVLIIPPSQLSKLEVVSTHYPINLGYIASCLQEHNIEVELWDYNVEAFTINSFIERVKESTPDLMGFSCMTLNIKIGNYLASSAKKVDSRIFMVVAGAHSTALPVQTLQEFPHFDAVIVGDGEETIVELCNKLKNKTLLKGTLGICHRINGDIVLEAPRPLMGDLDNIPFPNRDLGKQKLYVKSHVSRGISRKYLNVMEIIISRGCSYECIFCATHLAYKRRVRFRSLDNVFKEIKIGIEKYGINHVEILDDTFTLNKPMVYEFCRRVKGLGISWSCETRVDQVDQLMLNAMADAGVLKISFGVESGSQKILNLIKKQITVEQVINAFKMARKAGIKLVEGTFMIGSHISETKDDVKKTIKLIKKIKPDLISVAILTPLPGTETYSVMKDKGYILAQDWDQFMYVGGLPTWRTTYFSPKDLVQLQKKVLMSFYLSPYYIFRMLKKIKSVKEFKYWFDIGLEFLRKIVLPHKTY